MKVLIAASEAVPFASSGGLGSVIGSLPYALKRQDDNTEIRVVLPLYSEIPELYRNEMKYICCFRVMLGWRNQYCGVFGYEKDGIIFYFLENEYYFKRNTLYGSFDDAERFAFFSKSILEMIKQIDFMPDILHANDWQCALSVIYNKCLNIFPEMKTVYSIHNIEYQGRYSEKLICDVFGLGSEFLNTVSFDGDINLSKGAMVCCDMLTTVSPCYANELKHSYYARGLESIIRENSNKMHGILNGIDYGFYNPELKDIVFPFSKKSIWRKKKNKTELQKELGLKTDEDVPIISMITRLAEHKGIDLVKCVIDEMLKADVQFVLLGSGELYGDFFYNLSQRYPGKVGIRFGFDTELSKRIYASSDIFLMPSRTEPCGIAQMIACAYGCVPIVRQTGGLFDTVKPYKSVTKEGNGITFGSYNAHDMLDAIWRAVRLYSDKAEWEILRRNAMETDFSWDKPAREYLNLYCKLSGCK